MSDPLFQARFEVTYVESLGGDPALWRLTGTVIDASGMGFGPANAAVGDLVFDEDTTTFYGTVNAWRITEIVSAGGNLVVKVQYNESGIPAGLGEPQAGSCAICRPTVGSLRLSQAPATGWTQLGETILHSVRNFDSRTVGASGVQGAQGSQGTLGVDGNQGPQGVGGTDGAQGPQGDLGTDGAQGPQGDLGTDGAQGPQGDLGTDGVQGFQGDLGTDGVQGPQGDLGTDGTQGPQGDLGTDGTQGPQGWQGDPSTEVGPQGPQGVDGPQGFQGPQAVWG